MINTKLSSQVATQRTDLKNDLNLTKDKEKLSPNELLTQNLRQKLGLSKQMPPPNEALQKFAQNELNQKLQEIVNKLLNQISTHKNPNSPILKQANLLNFAPNFVNELKLLSKELSKNENFAPLLNRIEMLLKPASEIKAKDLAPLLKNSGVFFEAKLKNALNEELLPKSFYKLINAIKSLSSEKIATQIATLADKSLSAKDSLKELASIIIQNKNENKNIVSHSTFKPLLELSQKLDNFKKYINKNPQLAESKISSLAQNFAKELAKIKDDFVKILSKPENLLVKDPVLLKQAMQSFEKLQNHLDKIIQKAESGVKIESEALLKELLESQDEPLKTKGELKTQDEPKEQIKDREEEFKNENDNEKVESEEEIEREFEKEEVQKEDFSKDEKLENAEKNVGENLEKDTEKNAENLDKEVVKKQADIKEEPKEQKHQAKELTKEQVREYPKEALKSGVKQEDRVQIPQNKAQESIFKQQELTKEAFKNLAFKAPQGQNLEGLEKLSKDITTLNRKINENLKQLDPLAQNAKLNLNELKGLENKLIGAVKDLQNIRLKNVQDVSYEIQNDIKSTLLQVASQAKAENNDAIYNQANRLLAQIEMNQLISLANDSINTYLPFSWDDLNESKIIFRRGKKDKFFAQIKLEFAKLGDLEILVSLNNEKYIDINIMAENKEFRKMIYENAHELKRNINKAGLLSSNFFVGDIIRSHFDPRDLRNYDLQMGMDKKV
ncbi:flagellar hook-length control protein FliK [Campylobacter upsaliensis]|uniref:flagellar hook-length control protein FliK n=1 Tax=Campylobacter upsaliensis TaxID=28080 RepID=UPI001274B537|nr:flagellar hook-length control protein FliK [Campylobacter upsaliensis]EAJ7018119.1 flagellar hook-length control protein FliK [Campylobacter upsaliensis]EAJ7109193.1 flagellar hook-length control protein FliK [Campylobacter upsaliensis]EAJ7576111.1 flagellar hook-length control protein FliK [Campylobacter upsaliensis]EAK0491446.1 flagellar hook-length control protein FliK [Campylobacter upsaliensis]EAW0584155.1 flagellar hook-length control protein FliK [Campylobacter upsaliensis]